MKKFYSEIYNVLISHNKTPKSELNYNNVFELMVAVILSAQCLDSTVNKVTPILFNKYKTIMALASAKKEDVEQILKPVNFYKNKTKYIISVANRIVLEFNGIVPSTVEELCTLDGVSRKTAQVVLVEGFNIPAMPVDTHVFRVYNRLNNFELKNVSETENHIRANYDEKFLGNLHKLLVLHGRYICKAKKPLCETCPLKNLCKYENKTE